MEEGKDMDREEFEGFQRCLISVWSSRTTFESNLLAQNWLETSLGFQGICRLSYFCDGTFYVPRSRIMGLGGGE